MSEQETYRLLYCPICGERVRVSTKVKIPESYTLPDHMPLGNVNLCAGVAVIVTLDWVKCRECGRQMGKHGSGVCIDCFKG